MVIHHHPPPLASRARTLGLVILRGYLVLATAAVIAKVISLTVQLRG